MTDREKEIEDAATETGDAAKKLGSKILDLGKTVGKNGLELSRDYGANTILGVTGALVAYQALTEDREEKEGLMKQIGRYARAGLGSVAALVAVLEPLYRNNTFGLQEKLGERVPYVSRVDIVAGE